jgi:dihydrofolate reductase
VGKVQLYIGASLDGFIADSDGGVAWLERFLVEGEDYGYGEFMSGVGALAMGARTFEDDLARPEWPYGDTPTWVFTHRDLPTPDGATVHLTSAAIPDVLRQIRERTDGNVFLVGGADLVRQFLAAKAIDELILTVAPVLLGDGIRLFDGSGPARATHLSARSYATGLVQLQYALRTDGQ